MTGRDEGGATDPAPEGHAPDDAASGEVVEGRAEITPFAAVTRYFQRSAQEIGLSEEMSRVLASS